MMIYFYFCVQYGFLYLLHEQIGESTQTVLFSQTNKTKFRFVSHFRLWDPPALDHYTVLIEAVKHADLQVNVGLNYPHRNADCNTPHLDGYLFESTCLYIKQH